MEWHTKLSVWIVSREGSLLPCMLSVACARGKTSAMAPVLAIYNSIIKTHRDTGHFRKKGVYPEIPAPGNYVPRTSSMALNLENHLPLRKTAEE